MQEHDRLAGPGPPGQAERSRIRALSVLALLGMEEDTPGAEVATFDHPAQFRVVLDPSEGHLGGWMAQALHQAVRITRRRFRSCRRRAEAQLVLDLRDAEAGGQVEKRQALPFDGVLGPRHQRVLIRCGQGPGGQRLVDAEDINQGLAVKTQADQQRHGRRRRGLGGNRLDGRVGPRRRW